MEAMKEYEVANQEAEKIFLNLGLTVNVSAPIADVRGDWPNILFNVSFSKGVKNALVQYRVGVGHVKWPKTYEQIPDRTPVDLIPVFNTLRSNPGAILKNKSEHARAAVLLAVAQSFKPKPYEVFACVCNDGLTAHRQSFSEYCGEFGMNPDSIKDKATYEFCCELYHQLAALVDRATIEKLAELHSQF